MTNTRDILIKILTQGDPKGAENIGTALDNVAEKADQLGKSLSLRVTAPLTALAGAAVFVSTQFDSAFREVTTLLDGPAEGIAALRKDIRDMADELGVDLVDSTKAAYNALSAGVPQDNIISFLETAAKTGIAGVASTNESVELLTGLMNTYGIEMSRANEVSDLLFTTVKNGVTTIPKLGQALGQVAPTASAAGVGLDELLAAMATVTKQTGNTAQASTGLSAAIISLLNPSETLAEIYREQGIEGGRALIAQRGLAGALDLVAQATEGSDQKFIKAIGSVEAYRAAVNLTGENARKAQGDLEAMGESAGATEEAFGKMDEGAGASMRKLKASTTELLNVLGEQLLPTVIGVADGLTGAAQAAADLPPGVVAAGVAIGGLAAAAGPGIVVLGAVIRNLRLIRRVAPGAGAALGKLSLVLAAFGAGWQLGEKIDELTGFSEAIGEVSARAAEAEGNLENFLADELSGLRERAREMRTAADLEEVRSEAIRKRGSSVALLNRAIAAGDEESAGRYERQIAATDRILAALDGVLARNRERAQIEEQINEAAAENNGLSSEGVQLLLDKVALTEEQLDLIDGVTANFELENEILRAQIENNGTKLAQLKQEKDEQRLIQQLRKAGLTEERGFDPVAMAKERVRLEKEAADAEARRRGDAGRTNDILRERVGLQKELTAEEARAARMRELGATRSETTIGIDGRREEVFFDGGRKLGTEDQINQSRERFGGPSASMEGNAPSPPAAEAPGGAAQGSGKAPVIDTAPVAAAMEAAAPDLSELTDVIVRGFESIQQQLDQLASRIEEAGN